jgi:short-subunit dehydrogenase
MTTIFPANRTIDVLIFKTNIRYMKDVHKIAPYLRGEQKIRRWNVDLGDIDKVLRIEAEELSTGQVQILVNQAGYFCEELID